MTDPVLVWVVPLGAPGPDVARLAALLDDEERARLAALVDPVERGRFTVAHGALRVLAGAALDAAPAALCWDRGRYGKPTLAAPWSGLHTSLSHSGDLAVVALSAGRPVGVDVQHAAPGMDPVALSARFFSPGEAAYVAAATGTRARAERMAELWTRKEAVVKAAGGRMWANLAIEVHGRDLVRAREPDGVHRVAEVAVPPGYRAAVALAGPQPYAVQVRPWSAAAPAPARAGAAPPLPATSPPPAPAPAGAAPAAGRARPG